MRPQILVQIDLRMHYMQHRILKISRKGGGTDTSLAALLPYGFAALPQHKQWNHSALLICWAETYSR